MPEIVEVERASHEPAQPDGTIQTPRLPSGKVDWAAIPKDAVFELEVQGQKVVVSGDKLPQLAQMGYRFSDRMREVTQREAELDQTYAPIKKFDEFLKANPKFRKLVKAAAQEDWNTVLSLVPHDGTRPAVAPGFTPGDGSDGNGSDGTDFYMQAITRLGQQHQQEMAQLREELRETLGNVGASVQGLTARAAEAEQVQTLKTDPRYARIASDDNVTLARDYQRKYGGDLITAFRMVTYDQLPAIIENETVTRYGIDREAFSMPGSSAPTINGVVLDDQTMKQLFDDPDELAKHVEAIRAHRRRTKGQMRHPSVRRR